MTYEKRTVLVFAAALAIIMPFAYADEDEFAGVDSECLRYESVDVTGVGNVTTKQLICKWEIKEIAKPKVSAVQNMTDAEKELIKEAIKCRSDPECAPVVTEPPKKSKKVLTQEEELLEEAQTKIQRYCEQPGLEGLKLLACQSYQGAKLCEQGINESQPVQKHRFFLTTDFELSIWYHFNYDKGLSWVVGVLQKAKLECDYQRDILEPIILGPQYANIEKATRNDGQPYHAEMAASKSIIQRLETTPAVFANANNVAFETKCNTGHFAGSWQDWGCPVKTVQDCYMPTDVQLITLSNSDMWLPEWATTPIKQYYQNKFEECVEKVEAGKENRKPVGWYDDYINSLPPMVKANAYKNNEYDYKPGQFIYGQVGDWKVPLGP
jgi:hypothetical protein